VFLLVVLRKNLVSAESQGQNRSESLTGISGVPLKFQKFQNVSTMREYYRQSRRKVS
jgi:hypothetical protein